jgi:peroxiredoxin
MAEERAHVSSRFLVRSAPIALALMATLVTTGPRTLSRAEDAASVQHSISAERSFPQESLPDSAGGELSLPKSRGRVATVLVSMSVECPISNEYIPTLNRLAERFGPRGVNLIGINPDASQTLSEMANHARETKLAFPFLQDTAGKISRRLQFSVTPEVCVFDAAGKVVYSGRIDDRYRARGAATHDEVVTDLENAVNELVAGKPVANARTKAIGCPIQFGPAPAHTSPSSSAPDRATSQLR